MRVARGSGIALGAALTLAALAACEQEKRRFTETPPAATAETFVTVSALQPGPTVRKVDADSPYDENAYAVSEGKRLFNWMNCSGCHSNGGGGMGPPLIDDEWIYGNEPENIFSTIVEGRPNGMPAFRGKLGNQQVWQLVAYVRTLSGQGPKNARSGRGDHMSVKHSEQNTGRERPRNAGVPPASVTP